jgi:hypothetical protein
MVGIVVVIPSPGAAIAAQMAAQKRTDDCLAWIPGYKHDLASIEQMQYYASCVQWLHPISTNNTQVLWFKAAIFAVFLGSVIGIWCMQKSDVFETWYARALCGGLIGACVGPTVVLTCASAYYGFLYLLK